MDVTDGPQLVEAAVLISEAAEAGACLAEYQKSNEGVMQHRQTMVSD